MDFSNVRMVDINDINIEKENVVPLKSGRSAAELADKFQKDPSSYSRAQRIQEQCNEYETRIKNIDLKTDDDPFDLHYQYIRWMQQECTFGHAELMKVIERAVREFRKDERYKNDPRYLKLWLMVAKNTKEPVEVFKYLSLNRIGAQNATFYEEYAGYMESVQRYQDASDIFEQGIGRNAQPYDRLVKRFQEFKSRTSGKVDALPFTNPNPNALQHIQGSTIQQQSFKKEKSNGFAVYKDLKETRGNPLPIAPEHGNWDDFNSLSLGKKENSVKVEQMVGATLKQETIPSTGQSFKVFNDTAVPQQKKECMVCDLSLLYIGDEEFSLEELRALRLGYALMDDEIEPTTDLIEPEASMSICEPEELATAEKSFVLKTPLAPQVRIPSESPIESPQLESFKIPITLSKKQVASPTINTRNAMKDVFQMFSQPILEEEEDVTISAQVYKPEFSSFTIANESDSTNNGFKVFNDSQEKPQKTRKPLGAKPMDTSFDEANPYFFKGKPPIESTPCQQKSSLFNRSLQRIHQNFDLMTPIAELSYEDRTFAGFSTINSQRVVDLDHTQTSFADKSILSPVEEQPDFLQEFEVEAIQTENPCNPRSKSIQIKIYQMILSFLKSQPNLFDLRLNECSFEQSLEAVQKGRKVKIELEEFGKMLVLQKVGQGSFAKIYRMTREDMTEYALKMSDNPFPWEFYILSQLKQRLSTEMQESIIQLHACHVYKDQVATTLSYMDQGTLIDCVNNALKDGYGSSSMTTGDVNYSGVDELLAMFWAIELIEIVAAIHNIGIIHGDLKADNVLVRIKDECYLNSRIESWDANYQPDGTGGWASKGLVLIDWGSAIDCKCFEPETEFIIQESAELDPAIECWQIRNRKKWKIRS